MSIGIVRVVCVCELCEENVHSLSTPLRRERATTQRERSLARTLARLARALCRCSVSARCDVCTPTTHAHWLYRSQNDRSPPSALAGKAARRLGRVNADVAASIRSRRDATGASWLLLALALTLREARRLPRTTLTQRGEAPGAALCCSFACCIIVRPADAAAADLCVCREVCGVVPCGFVLSSRATGLGNGNYMKMHPQ